jgi:hypothetical protein
LKVNEESDVSEREPFFETDAGKLTQYRRRKRRRLYIHLDDIEPQSKKMSEADKDDFQRKILRELKDVGRAAFRGPLALSVQLSTTGATAPQAHTIAKNLLDLLGPRRPNVRSSRNELLYKDDSQIHALSVACAHGEERPMIGFTQARSARRLMILNSPRTPCEVSTRTIPTKSANPSSRSGGSSPRSASSEAGLGTSSTRRW